MRKLADSVKKSKGTFRKSRENESVNILPISGIKIPSQLSGAAKKEWQEIAPTLTGDKLLTGLDRKILMMYCEEMAKYWKYQVEMKTQDTVLELLSKEGVVVNYRTNPLLELSDRALSNAHKLGMHFGLTPLSRTKINLPSQKADSPAERAKNKLEEIKSKSTGMVKMA